MLKSWKTHTLQPSDPWRF